MLVRSSLNCVQKPKEDCAEPLNRLTILALERGVAQVYQKTFRIGVKVAMV